MWKAFNLTFPEWVSKNLKSNLRIVDLPVTESNMWMRIKD